MIRQAVVALALWAVASEPEALLGDECEDEHCAFSALQRRGVRKENFEDFKVDEDALARFMEESVKAQSLAQVDEEVELDEAMHVNYTHLLSMGCFAKPEEYRLSWRAAGRDFFDQFTFLVEDDTHGAQKYLTKQEAIQKKVITLGPTGSAQIRVGELVPTGDPNAPYKRLSVMIHSNYAWQPSAGMLTVMKYNHVPYGPSVWPAFWLMNSDNVWPKGGEFDIMEYANDEASKITFHADRNCMLDNRKLGECMRGKHMGGPGPSNCNTNYWKNMFGCRPRQVQKTGAWYAKNPGVIAAAWDEDGITVYHIPEHQIPADLKADKPRPEAWGEFVVAYLPMHHHSCQNIAEPQEIVLNIALCGDWAGNGWFRSHEARSTGFTHGCGPMIFEPNHDCCTHFATSRDARVEDMFRRQAYFDIDYLKVYVPAGSKIPNQSGVKRRGTLLH